jgi:hypothetical protein
MHTPAAQTLPDLQSVGFVHATGVVRHLPLEHFFPLAQSVVMQHFWLLYQAPAMSTITSAIETPYAYRSFISGVIAMTDTKRQRYTGAQKK